MNKILLVAFFILLLSLSVFSQQYTSASRKAIKNYEKAISEFKQAHYDASLISVNDAINEDSQFIEAYLLQAEIFHSLKKYELEMEAFEKAIAIDRNFFPKSFIFLAELQLRHGKYSEALKNSIEFLAFQKNTESLIKKAELIKRDALFGNFHVQNPVAFNPQNLGNTVNTEYNDYWPSLTVDETQLFITVRIPDNQAISKYREDLYVSYNESAFFTDSACGKWTKSKVLPAPLTTSGNEGACSVSADGRILFFTRCTCPDGLEKCCDIYYSVKQGNTWSEAQKMPGFLNSESWDAQPSISSDGTELYFASSRKGGFGGQDIWVSKLNLETGNWGKPINLGDSINTSGDEMSPFIHPDNQTLYFSSDFWQGMGGLDLFLSRKNENGNWITPQNMGYPINTYRDEIGLITNSRGNLAYFSSNRMANDLDIYTFELPLTIRPIPVKYIKGIVIDAQTRKPLQAKFSFIDEKTNIQLISSYSDYSSGEFFISLPINYNYLLNVQRSNYLFYSSNFLLQENKNSLNPLILTVELQPIKIGETIVLKNIFFKTASYELLDKSNYELDKLYHLLLENESISKVEISGHTDNEGTEKYNLELSENRAKSVYNYLINRGISKERLTFKGYGYQVPVADNATQEGRALNRRTEFKILNCK